MSNPLTRPIPVWLSVLSCVLGMVLSYCVYRVSGWRVPDSGVVSATPVIKKPDFPKEVDIPGNPWHPIEVCYDGSVYIINGHGGIAPKLVAIQSGNPSAQVVPCR